VIIVLVAVVSIFSAADTASVRTWPKRIVCTGIPGAPGPRGVNGLRGPTGYKGATGAPGSPRRVARQAVGCPGTLNLEYHEQSMKTADMLQITNYHTVKIIVSFLIIITHK